MSKKDIVKEAPYQPGYESAYDHFDYDKGYELGTHEDQQAFEKRRNRLTGMMIKEMETKAFLQMAEGMKALEQQLDDANRNLRIANERVAQLEAQIYGGNTK